MILSELIELSFFLTDLQILDCLATELKRR